MKAINLAQHKKTPMGIAAMQNFLEVGNKKAKGDFMILNVSVTKGLTVQLI
jgi:hypothetical protein